MKDLTAKQTQTIGKIRGRLKRLLGAYTELRFWTFTFYAEVPDEDKSRLWNLFMTRLRKKAGYKIWYLKVAEPHPGSGRLHFHVIFHTFVDIGHVRAIWKDIGAGLIVDVRLKVSGRKVAQYVAKYLTKSLEDGMTMRVITYSKQFCMNLSDWSKWCIKMVNRGDWLYFEQLVACGIDFWYVLNLADPEGEKWKRYWFVLDELVRSGRSILKRKLLCRT